MGQVLQEAIAAKKARAQRFTNAAKRYEDAKRFSEATCQMSVYEGTSMIEEVQAKPDLETFFSKAWKILEKDLSPIHRVQKLICKDFGVSRIDLISQRRTADIVLPRQVAMYLAKKLTVKSLPEIGRQFGGRDHTTVLHAVRKIEQMTATDAEFGIRIAALIAQHEDDER